MKLPIIDSSPSTEGISESIHAVTTRSQRPDSHEQAPLCSVTPELNLWSTPQDRQKVQHQQETGSDLSPIIQALKLGVRPAHANVVALSPLPVTTGAFGIPYHCTMDACIELSTGETARALTYSFWYPNPFKMMFYTRCITRSYRGIWGERKL